MDIMKRADLAHRLRKAEAATEPKNSLDRSRLLKSLLVTLTKLETRRKESMHIIREETKQLRQTNKDIKVINKKIDKLEPEDGFLVTEHALLRYLERYAGVDLEKIHAEIIALPDHDRIMASNTIVTVFPTTYDQFNLSQNERK
jgi:hypothetical protein